MLHSESLLFILYVAVNSVSSLLLSYPPSPSPLVKHKFVFYVCESVTVLETSSFLFFRFHISVIYICLSLPDLIHSVMIISRFPNI